MTKKEIHSILEEIFIDFDLTITDESIISFPKRFNEIMHRLSKFIDELNDDIETEKENEVKKEDE